MRDEIYTTKSAEQTEQLGEKIASRMQNGGVLCLYGELGAGKTTFVKGLARGLGITRPITSPTFIIMRTYEISGKRKEKRRNGMFYHVDLYRTESEKDIESVGLKEVLRDPKNIVVIEWPERMGDALPKKYRALYFSYNEDESRKICLTPHK